MAEALSVVEDAQLLAVASRGQTAADAFAQKWDVPRAYAGYDRLLADPDIDIVYVATPNAMHRENILAALDAGKHVLCEKPMTTSAADSQYCADYAAARDLFLMEAMWTAFFPAMQMAVDMIAAGAIGKPRHLTASFVSYRNPREFPNLFDPALGGGAALDLGIYPITIAQLLGGPIVSLSSQTVRGQNGVDEMTVVSGRHKSELLSQLSFGFRVDLPAETIVTGDAGQIIISNPCYRPEQIVVQKAGQREVISAPMVGNGYTHEVIEVQQCLASGLTESRKYPAAISVGTALLMEEILRV